MQRSTYQGSREGTSLNSAQTQISPIFGDSFLLLENEAFRKCRSSQNTADSCTKPQGPSENIRLLFVRLGVALVWGSVEAVRLSHQRLSLVEKVTDHTNGTLGPCPCLILTFLMPQEATTSSSFLSPCKMCEAYRVVWVLFRPTFLLVRNSCVFCLVCMTCFKLTKTD